MKAPNMSVMEQDPSPAVAPTHGSARTLLFGALKLFIVPATLVWVLSAVTRTEWSPTGLIDPKQLFIGLLVNQIALCVFAVRMQLVLRLFHVRIGWRSALRIHLQSMFYFFALPMTIGLEIARFIKIRHIQPTATVVQLSSALFLDRLLGAVSALAIAVLCLPFVGAKVTIEVPGWAWGAGIVVATIGSIAMLMWPRARGLLRDALRPAHGRWVALTGLFVLSMLVHVLFAVGVQLAANGLGLPVNLLETLFAVAGGMLLVAVPVSFAGLGLAEAGASGLFLATGCSPAVALTAGAIPYFARLVGALEGAVWELFASGAATIAAMRRLIAERQAF
jgi:uncharacterized membrane protein YbhN (UPF0104 family)